MAPYFCLSACHPSVSKKLELISKSSVSPWTVYMPITAGWSFIVTAKRDAVRPGELSDSYWCGGECSKATNTHLLRG